MKANVEMKKEISKKTNTEYSILIIEIINERNEKITIQDYGKEIPFELYDIEITISKNDKGFYLINE